MAQENGSRRGALVLARVWPLMAAGLCLLAGAGVLAAVLLYRRGGAVFYPSLAVVNYTLRGVPAQAVALLVGGVGFAALWVGLRRANRAWRSAAGLSLALAVVLLIAGASPYRPVSHAAAGSVVYRLATYQGDARGPTLYLLFACDATTGTLCRQVSAYAPFDVASGRHVSGSPALALDPATHAVTLRVAGHVIGVYRPE